MATSDTLPDDTWVNCFLSTPPRSLLNSLQRRLATSNYHVQALAEVFKERAAIEAEYAARLSKLVKTADKGELVKGGPTGDPWDKGSGEAKVWDAVLGDIQETSSTHSTLATILKTDFEQPIRDLPNKIVAWRRIGEQDASLDRTLKEYEKTSAKLDKANTKSGRGGKADALASDLNQVTSSLASLSPMVYTTYQRLDEERLRGLKEAVVRWGTVRADIAAKEGERADRSVAALIGWESADEVIVVGQKIGGAGGRSGSTAPSLGSTTPSRRMSMATNAGTDFSPAPPPPAPMSRPVPRQNGSSSNLSSRDRDGGSGGGGGGFASGLKSMLGRKSTVINRQRSGSEATSTRSVRRPDAFDQINEDVPEAASAPARGGPSPLIDDEGFSVAPADRHRAPWDDPSEELTTPTLAPTIAGGAATAPATTTSFPTRFTSSPDPSSDNVSSSGGQPASRLNLALTTAPIRESDAEREAAVAKMQQSLALPPAQPNRRSTIARGRRDVRNTMFGTVNEDGTTTLGGVNIGSGAPPLPEQDEVIASPVSTDFGGSPTTATALNGITSGTPKPVVTRQTSQSSIGSRNPFDSPGLGGAPTLTPIGSALGVPTLTGEGLRASINETVNVLFKAGGAVSRAQINGEIRLALAGSPPAASAGPIHIRLTEFEVLEKVAPNPAFLTQVPDRPGEFFLDPERLSAASGGAGSGSVLFRYQVHIPPGAEVHAAPLSLNPAFQNRSGETRMILAYKVDGSRGHVMSDLVLAAHFTGPEPSVASVQAKPAGGVWSPSARRMTWKLGGANETEGKVVAKFITAAADAGADGEVAVLTPTNVSATFTLSDVMSGLGIEVVAPEQGGAGAAGWSFAEIKRGAVAGKYSAEASLAS